MKPTTLMGTAVAGLLLLSPQVVFAANGSSTAAAVQTDTATTSAPAGSQPVAQLLQAAQQLRDATHALVNEKDVQQRAARIRSIDQTLSQVQAAIDNLPASMIVSETKEGAARKAETHMAEAADRLNTAAKDLNSSDHQKARRAVKDIQQALASVRSERTKIGNASSQTASK